MHYRTLLALVLCLILTSSLLGCGGDSEDENITPSEATSKPVSPTPTTIPTVSLKEGGQAMPFELKSPTFATGESIPTKYTCDDADISPPLEWNDPPQGTRSFALVCDDPDAPVGTWVHWVLYNLPPGTRSLGENADANLPEGTQHGKNSWGRSDYGGPCPPSGTHRYFFKLYALDTMLDLKAGAGTDQLIQAMQGHILGQAETMGLYARKK